LKSVAARIVFAPKDYPDAKEISDELGFTTVRVRSHSKPNFMAFNRQSGRSGSSTVSQQARALLLPQEVKEIGNDDALIFYEGLRPIRCRKIRYFADRRFRARLLPAPLHARPGIRRHPRLAPGAPAGIAPMLAPAGGEALTLDTPMPAATPMRAAGAEDMEQLDLLMIDDFGDRLKGLTFEQAGERPTDSELEADVDLFLDALRQ
jgi:type IV secretion system protein VirD4